MFSGASVLAIILAPQLNLLNRILHTTPLTLHQWLICIVSAFAAVVVTEIRKLVIRRRNAAPQEPISTTGEPRPAAG
jgi:hypothetical protein